jgi:hypothetical protein
MADEEVWEGEEEEEESTPGGRGRKRCRGGSDSEDNEIGRPGLSGTLAPKSSGGKRTLSGNASTLDPLISDDEDDRKEPPLEEDIEYGSAFSKADEYDKYLDEIIPWHSDLRRPLFPSRIISFRWMTDRHGKGGGIVAVKVGIGKVRSPVLELIHRRTQRSITSYG